MTRPDPARPSWGLVLLGVVAGLVTAVLVVHRPQAAAAGLVAVPVLGLLPALLLRRGDADRVWVRFAVGVALLLLGAPGTWSLLAPSAASSGAWSIVVPVLAVLTAVGAYAALFAGNLRLLQYQRSAVVPHVNAWFDGVASLFGLAAVLTATVVPALTARGTGTAAAFAWSARPALVLVLTSFAVANCLLVARGQRRRPVRVLMLFAVLLAAETVDLVHLSGGGDGSAVLPAVASGLRVLAVPLLVRAVRAPSEHPRVVADLGWATVAGPLGVFCLTMAAAFWRTAHPETSRLVLLLEVAALTLVAAKLVLLTRTLVSLLGSHRLSLLDELTGLANRRAFFAEVERVAAGVPLAVLLVDLDGFKAVNDQHGHRTGDLLLRDTAARLEDVVGPDGLVARLGGDEFVVLLTGARTACADDVALALVGQLGPREVDGRHLRVSASVGVAGPDATVALADAAGVTGRGRGEALLHAADVAMYRAKSAGGGARRAA